MKSGNVNFKEEKLKFDLVVIGGGVAGTVAAIAAARQGLKTALIHNRPNLGGPSSAECNQNSNGLCVNGAAEYHNANARETGIIEEMKIESIYRNAFGWEQHWSLVLREWAEKETSLALFMNTEAYAVKMNDNKIRSIKARMIDSDRNFVFSAATFIDCSGDSVIAHAAGAEFRIGREARSEFNESMAPEIADRKTMGSSICFKAIDKGHPVPFKAPEWAIKFTDEDLPYRLHKNPRHGYWWLEYGGELDTIGDNEKIYRKLLSVLYGIWDHVKNGGEHGAENYAINWIASYPGKRESRRLMGDYILTQNDVVNNTKFHDAVAYGGWPIDIHPPEGVFGKSHPGSTPPFIFPDVYDIPFRCLYSKNIDNLLMAGRNISVTHIALGTTRVMATCALCGQAVGTAAYLMKKHKASPREISKKYISELKEILYRNDSALPEEKFDIAENIAPFANVSASSSMKLSKGKITGAAPLIAPPKQTGKFFDPCDEPPKDRSRAQMFPVSSDRIDSITVWMNSKKTVPVTLTAKLRASAKADDFSSEKDLASAEAVINPGSEIAVKFDFNAKVSPGKLYWIVLPCVDDIEVCISERYLPAVYMKKDGCYQYNNNFCFEVSPAQEIFTPSNAVNGLTRAGNWPNMWISEPSQQAPQYLELSFEKTEKFNTVEIIFDTNLHRMVHAGAPHETVKDYEIQVADSDGNWQTIVTMKDNYSRRRVHNLPTIKASKIRFVANSTNGDESVRVYEIRIMKS